MTWYPSSFSKKSKCRCEVNGQEWSCRMLLQAKRACTHVSRTGNNLVNDFINGQVPPGSDSYS